ncbi:MAG: phosphoribosylanthranilate isomerase [bacterium]|nr:MAG: phosphoribosylanthranilate isomerase [bacterium]
MMLVKICGITNIEDALLALKSGAGALGFIFSPSKRQISPQKAADITAQLPNNVPKVGVFVDDHMENILHIAEIVRLTCIQLHGSENHTMCDELGKSFKVIKTVRIDPRGKIISKIDYSTWKILLDTYLPGVEGGSGMRFNWDILNELNLENIIVAGGIRPENIGELISEFKPFGIDLCSGVEAYPGKKDPHKLRCLFKQIKQYKPIF